MFLYIGGGYCYLGCDCIGVGVVWVVCVVGVVVDDYVFVCLYWYSGGGIGIGVVFCWLFWGVEIVGWFVDFGVGVGVVFGIVC